MLENILLVYIKRGKKTIVLKYLSKNIYIALLVFLVLAGLAIVVNPSSSIDVIVIVGTLLIIGHVLLKEKMILAFLIIRPIVDMWRDRILFVYEDYVINLNAVLAIAFLVWAAIMLVQYLKSYTKTPLYALLPFTGLLMLASTIYSVSPLQSIIEAIKFLNLPAFFALAYIFHKERKISFTEILWTTLIAAIIPLSAGILQAISRTGITTFEVRGRIFGTFAHPNVFAFYLLSLIFVLTHVSVIEKSSYWKKNTNLRNILYILLTVLLIMTFTRAAWIGLVVFVIIIGTFQYRKLLIYFFLISIIFYGIAFPFNEYLKENTDYNLQKIQLIRRITTRNEDADSISWRMSLMRETAPLIAARPWLGYGYGTFQKVWEENRSILHMFDDSSEAHNDYLRIFLEIGAVGLFVYLFLIIRLLQISFIPIIHPYKKEQKYILLFSWILTFAVVGLSDNMLHHTPVMWFMFSWWGILFSHYSKYFKAPNLLT